MMLLFENVSKIKKVLESDSIAQDRQETRGNWILRININNREVATTTVFEVWMILYWNNKGTVDEDEYQMKNIFVDA